jgi:putative nucleotidyltransferase with HDIG domain
MEMSKSQRVVIVDDNAEMGRAIQRSLRKLNLEITVYTNPVEAFKIIEKGSFELLITDYKMPSMSGVHLIRALKHHQPESIGILISGVNEFQVAISAINEGSVFKFLTKPYDDDVLIEYVTDGLRIIEEKKRFAQFKHWSFKLSNLTDENDVYRVIQSNAVQGLLDLMKAKDIGLYQHSVRVSDLSVQLGERLGLDSKRITNLKTAALLHDIGKLAIKDQILDKPTRLNVDEYSKVKLHAQVGADLLANLGVNSQIVLCVRQHHERVDKTGYPLKLSSEQIILEAKIVSILDVYDALKSKRSYKSSLDIKEIKETMLSLANKIFDVEILKSFFELLDESLEQLKIAEINVTEVMS